MGLHCSGKERAHTGNPSPEQEGTDWTLKGEGDLFPQSPKERGTSVSLTRGVKSEALFSPRCFPVAPVSDGC